MAMTVGSDDRKTFTRGRRFAIGANVLIVSALAPFVAALLIYLAHRPEVRRRLDLTSARTFELAERTTKVLDELQKLETPIDVYTCFRPMPYNSAGNFTPGLENVIALVAYHCNDLVSEFELRARGKLRAHVYDPNNTSHLARIGDLGKTIDKPAWNHVVVVHDKRVRTLDLRDLAEFDEGTQAQQSQRPPRLDGFRDEEAIAKALLAVTEEHEVKVGFVFSHGERDPAAFLHDANGRGGFAGFARLLQANDYHVALVDLVKTPILRKDDLDVLVVADPTSGLASAEVETIVRYVKEGGRVVALLGPSATNSLDFPLLEQLYDVTREPHPVCLETTLGIWRMEADVFFADAYSDHPIVQPLKSGHLKTQWKDVCPLTTIGRASDVTVTDLVWTDAQAWVDLPGPDGKENHQFDPGTEKRLPRVLAKAVQRADGGRAVLLGCADVVDDQNLNAQPGNRVLALSLVDWITSREQLISIPPRPYDVVQVDLTPKEYDTIALEICGGVPAIALLLGIVVFWTRRT
jgi:hypothetical protein